MRQDRIIQASILRARDCGHPTSGDRLGRRRAVPPGPQGALKQWQLSYQELAHLSDSASFAPLLGCRGGARAEIQRQRDQGRDRHAAAPG